MRQDKLILDRLAGGGALATVIEGGSDAAGESPCSSCLPARRACGSRTDSEFLLPSRAHTARCLDAAPGVFISSQCIHIKEYLMSDWQCDFFCFFRCC
ncbi:hypothetical protein MATL_G00111180 [Megalops atlanticus]|uniref:Uncharacterized protein n=1 Tax=Megalops atlanticus TaxID=7932 RepID=A0A9D3Q578_MEGAT|nr:hypothetical protein MATL_G00111180 [Megalops atlanticus]